MEAGQRANRSVEHEIFGTFVEQLLDIELLAAVLAECAVGIDLALHHIVLAVDRRQAALRLDQDQPVHAVGDVMGDHGRRTVIHEQARGQRLEPETLLLARIGLGGGSAAAGTGGRVEVDRVQHRAAVGVLQVDLDRVADAHAQHRARHLAVEGPVAERRALCEPRLELDRDEVDPHRLRPAIADRRRHLVRLLRNVGLHHGLRRWLRRDEEFAFHAGQPVSRHAAIVGIVAGPAGGERNARARTASDDVRRASRRSVIVKDDVMLGALAVDQRHLDNLALGSRQQRIDLTVDRAADADEHHAAFGDTGAQRIAQARHIVCSRRPRRRRGHRLRLCRGRGGRRSLSRLSARRRSGRRSSRRGASLRNLRE